MKRERVWFIICGETTDCYMIALVRAISFGIAEFLDISHRLMLGKNTTFREVDILPSLVIISLSSQNVVLFCNCNIWAGSRNSEIPSAVNHRYSPLELTGLFYLN
jgi:hypothetical protein